MDQNILGYKLQDVFFGQIISLFMYAFMTWYLDKIIPSADEIV